MKKTLYLKFLLVYLCFGLLSFISISVISSKLIENYLVKKQTEAMYREANTIAAGQLSASLSDTYTQLGMLSTYQSMELWLMNQQGEILIDTSKEYSETAVGQIENFDLTQLTGSYYQKGRFFDYFSSDVLSVVAPITSNYNIKGYIAIHYDITKLEAEKNAVLNVCYITLRIIFLLSLLVLLAFTFMVYRPLQKIIRAANEYAAGHLDYKLEIENDDEMGYLAASMNYMASELNQSGNYQRNFISNISHDFRSPLTSIKGYVEAILDGTIPVEMQDRYLNIVLTETDRLNNLTRGLLTLNTFDDKGMYLEITNFDINEVIKKTSAAFEGICEKKNLTIQLLLDDINLYVSADMGKIQQVLYNLIDNAIKFSHPHSTLFIETTKRYEKVFVSIKDTGIGIPKESIQKIWDRFYKTDISRGKDKKGTGLGLAITKEIIQAHNENINVVSTQEVGTEFTFTLSCAKEKE